MNSLYRNRVGPSKRFTVFLVSECQKMENTLAGPGGSVPVIAQVCLASGYISRSVRRFFNNALNPNEISRLKRKNNLTGCMSGFNVAMGLPGFGHGVDVVNMGDEPAGCHPLGELFQIRRR